MTVGAPLTDFRFFLGGTRTVKTGDVLFLLGFCLHLLFLWLAKFGTFEGDAVVIAVVISSSLTCRCIGTVLDVF